MGNTHCLYKGPKGPQGNPRFGAGPQKWNRPAGLFKNIEPPRPEKMGNFSKMEPPHAKNG